MKHKMLALVLALTVISCGQNATQTIPTDPKGSTAAEKKCPCCDKTASASAKDAGMQCERMKSADGEEMSCCGGKEAKSCMKDKKASASCCKDGCEKDEKASESCGKECEKQCKNGCCSSSKTEKASTGCCKHKARR